MKYYTFYRENNDFSDIENDLIVEKLISTKIKWTHHMMIGITEYKNEQNFSYIALKYSEDFAGELYKDFTPVMGVDYTPKKKKNA